MVALQLAIFSLLRSLTSKYFSTAVSSKINHPLDRLFFTCELLDIGAAPPELSGGAPLAAPRLDAARGGGVATAAAGAGAGAGAGEADERAHARARESRHPAESRDQA